MILPQSSLQARWFLFRQRWQIFKKNRLAVIGLGIIIAFLTMALFAPLLAPYGNPPEKRR